MALKKSIFIGMCVISVIGVSYAVYWDYMRQTNPEFRKKWKKSKKKAAKQKKAAAEDAKVRVANFVGKAVEEVANETFPADVTAKENYFMGQVSKGEDLFKKGEDFYLDAALCFYKALKVYPNPVELIMIYQKTVPEEVFNLVYEMMSLEVKKKQSEYFDYFPPKEMNVRIKEIGQGSSDEHARRGIFATKDYSPGDVIFKEQPIVSALDPSLETGDYCSYCLKELTGGSIHDDSDLFEAVYCSKNCQDKAMNEYAALLFTSNDPSDPESKEAQLVGQVKSGNVKFPLMIARFLAKMVHEETQKVATGVDEEYTTWDHIERLRFLSVPSTEKEAKEIKLLKDLFAAKVPGMEEFISEERYLMLKGKLMYNAYGINTSRDNERNIRENTEETIRSSKPPVIGAGFYRVASYITHSCDPNTETGFPSKNYELSVVAIKHIKAGDELKISYIRTGHRDFNIRREELEAKWRLRCECTKCRSESGEYESTV